MIMRDSVSGYVDRNAKVCITAKSNPDDSMSLVNKYSGYRLSSARDESKVIGCLPYFWPFL